MATRYDILQLIPQRPPIVMVTTFDGFNGNTSLTTFAIQPDNLFVADGKLQESGVIEHIAQSAAARCGYESLSRGEDVPLGYIGAVEKLQLFSLPSVGDNLTTRIEVLQEVFGITLVEAETRSDDRPICRCRMKIFIESKHEKKA